MNTETKKGQLIEFVKVLKENGFKVYAPAKLSTYCNFVKDDKIGYVERGDYGFNFSTVHKPCQECGTGYSIHRGISNPTVEMAGDCFVVAPDWASTTDRRAIKKYKNWEDYAGCRVNQIIPTLEL